MKKAKTAPLAPHLTPSQEMPQVGRVGYGWYRIIINSYKGHNNATEAEARRWYRENRIGNFWRMTPATTQKHWRAFREALIQLGWKSRSDRSKPGNTPKALLIQARDARRLQQARRSQQARRARQAGR